MGPACVRLHDYIAGVWHSAILSTGLSARVEPRSLYRDQRRPDIVVPTFQGGQDLHLDFSATHHCLPSNVATASTTPGAAAAKRENVKKEVYRDCAGIFLPLMVEHNGRWGKSSIHLLNYLAKKAGESLIPGVTQGQFRDFWCEVIRLRHELVRSVAFTVMHNAADWFHSFHHIEELQHALSCFL